MSEIPNTILEAMNVAQLPTFPRVLVRLMELLERESTGWREIAEVIGTDSGLTARVLAAAGSVANRRAHQVAELEPALNLLGRDAVQTIAISASIYQVFGQMSPDTRFNLANYWRHSLGCAAIARGLARQAGYRSPEEAYLAGLMHDVGQLLMSSGLAERYANLCAGLMDERTLSDRELQHLGTTHSQVGAWVMERWALDSFIADSARYHHAPAARLANAHPLIRIVALAEVLSSGSAISDVADDAMRLLGLTVSQMETVIGGAEDTVARVSESLGLVADGAMDSDTLSVSRDDAMARWVAEHSLLGAARAPVDGTIGPLSRLLAARQSLALVFGVRKAIFLLATEGGRLLSGVRLPGDDWLVGDLAVPAAAPDCVVSECLRQKRLLQGGPARAGQEPMAIADATLLRVLGEECFLAQPLSSGGVLVIGGTLGEVSALQARARLLALFADAVAAALAREPADEPVAPAQGISVAAARVIAHEANNPLGIIKNYTASLRRRLAGGDPALLRDLDVIGEEIDRVATIIRRFGEPAPVSESGRRTDLNGLIATLLPFWERTLFASAGIRIESRLAPEAPVVAADRDGLKQVLLNLVKNAAEAMPSGGVFSIATLAGINRDGMSCVAIEIDDSGPGIPPAMLEHLFGPLDTQKAGEHAGLGLTICREILRDFNGTIICRTGKRGGACFEILLPRA